MPHSPPSSLRTPARKAAARSASYSRQPYHCAVLDVAKLAAGDIAFGSNSWRGDQYEPHLRAETTGHGWRSETSPFNIEAILAKHQQIAAIWGIEDVKSIRPDLSDEQAWEVLQMVDRDKDAELGITWLTLEMAAEDLFGNAPETNSEEA